MTNHQSQPATNSIILYFGSSERFTVMGANLRRNAKSGHDWNSNDLEAYNISISRQDTTTFFGQATLPPPSHHSDFLNTLTRADFPPLPLDSYSNRWTAAEKDIRESYEIMQYMDMAMKIVPDEESAVVDLALNLLRLMGYARRGPGWSGIRSRKTIPLLICGEWRYARPDVCVMSTQTSLGEHQLLVQEDRRHKEPGDPVPQLIAEAIAAVQYNHGIRDMVGADPFDVKVMAGITLTGTSPTFFKIPVTLELIEAVQRGDYPANPTVVAMHLPEIPRPANRITEGMKPLDNRRSILACFEAFKQFVN